ncbi:MAG TPA: prepilin-type N-terminal cleavage/methylation domain-containing protein [Patescibacteria group bacterium]|jgi:prepilin-type N-terminal cleavage/methylation domain-containing protein|nr:prepilin-type N-terminal cleavage/methylation domain-containing protein [Patescibacteria group bacterium]
MNYKKFKINNSQNHQSGFTLVEMVVAISIFTVVSVGLMYLVGVVFSQASKSGNTIADADQTRRLSNNIMQELRNAITASNGAYAIDTAGDQQLIFYSNVDGGTDIERVRYYLSNGKLYKGIIKQSGSPVNYNGTETSTLVQNDIANNGSTPLFYYYDNTFDDNTDNPLTQPVNIANVTYIKLNIQVFKKGTANATGYYTVNSGAAIRSLKTNL